MNRAVVFGYGHHVGAVLALLGRQSVSVAGLVLPWNRRGPEIEATVVTAESNGVPVWTQPRRSEIGPFLESLRRADPDILLVWSYALLLPDAVCAVARRGAVNVHGALLPEYRGGHVKQWAIINGERESGVTLHYIDDGVDTGPVIAQERFPLDPEEDFHSLGRKIESSGLGLLERCLPDILAGRAPRLPQDETRARYWPMRTPEQGRIEWSMSADVICRLVRALVANRPGAFVDTARGRVSLRRVTRVQAAAGDRIPGALVSVDHHGVRVAATDDDVLIVEAESQGLACRGKDLAALFGR